ncbi:hypothetical protein G7054_g14035 [Neopestalotiopsis clavispora]|nr:hypothetical protein G7054_g14035 [Neopestalotiopsis clavispora]
MASSALEYDQLDRSVQSIRLLHIIPYADTLDCVMETFDIRECPRYQALSYVWGSDIAGSQICINKTLVAVRNNLWDALWELKRLRGRPEFPHQCEDYIWIDAICINQTDDVERSHQVNLMSVIFSHATQTIAWLGREENNSALAMQTLAAKQCPQELTSTVSLAQRWTAIDALFSRPYFERMWIVQEVLLSQRLLLLCGPSFCSWHDIIWFQNQEQMWKKEDLHIISRWPSTLISTKGYLNRHHSTESVQKLQYLLLHVRDRQCLDKRDKIYALLGIINQSSDSDARLEADYTISIAELYLRMITFFKVLPEGDRNVIHAELLNILDMPLSTRHAIRLARNINNIVCKMDHHSLGSTLGSLDVVRSVEDRAFVCMILCEIDARFGIDLTCFSGALGAPDFSRMTITGHMSRDVVTFLISCHERMVLLMHLWQRCIKLDSHLQSLVLLPSLPGSHGMEWKKYAMAASYAGLLDMSVFMEKAKDVLAIVMECETGFWWVDFSRPQASIVPEESTWQL